MRLRDIFPRRTQPPAARLEVTGSAGFSSGYSGDAYAIDTFRSGIDAIARVMAKVELRPTATFADGSTAPCDPRLTRLLTVEPNPLMAADQWLYQLVTHLYLYDNSYSYIQRDTSGKVVGLWPLHVAQCEMREATDGTPFCILRFRSGGSAIVPYSSLIHLRRFFNSQDVLGDSNDALTPALKLADAQNQGALREIQTSGSITGVVRAATTLAPEKLDVLSRSFEKMFLNPDRGYSILPLDPTLEWLPIEPKTVTISSEDQEATAKKVLGYLGISSSIVDSTFTDDQFAAFTESVVESLALQLELECSRKLYPGRTDRRVVCSTARISFMASDRRTALLHEAMPAGLLTVNEGRQLLGLPPIEGGDVRLQSLNFVDASKALEYQLFRAGNSGIRTLGTGPDTVVNEEDMDG